ncbi:MAG: hypothetical protein IJA62_06065 [Ruminococcus sp.]|nr:hypothetical protein [Ruminococcus sp.]
MRSGEIIKSASSTATAQELELINKYTRREFAPSEVYVFSVELCNNDVDRDFERFTVESLFEMEKLFVGKTGICDHNPKAENQTARIFKCSVQAVEGRKTLSGDDYFRLVARAYMPISDKTKDMISQIESGICKEVSVGCSAGRAVCSVCGKERQEHCGHIGGEYYGNRLCYFELQNVKDAYEWSFVAVPAQREAGVIKAYAQGGRKEGTDMTDIIKSLNSGDGVTLSVEQAKRLYDYISSVEKRAAQGDEYLESVKSEVLRLSQMAEPGVTRKTMESALEGLSYSQLREFYEAYKDKAEKRFGLAPQTAKTSPASKAEDNRDFRI